MSGGEWLSSRELAALLSRSAMQRGALTAYMKNGLGRARALKATYRRDAGMPVVLSPDEDLPSWIWETGQGGARLDLMSGTYSARVYRPGGSVMVEALGLRFGSAIVEALGIEQRPAPTIATPSKGGAPRSEKWDDWIAALVVLVGEGTVNGSMTDSQLMNAVNEKLATWGKDELSRSTVQSAAKRTLERVREAGW